MSPEIAPDSKVRARLAELGLHLPETPKPLAAYVPAVISNNLVFTAGQLPILAGELAEAGSVPSGVSRERAKELAGICVLNALAAIESVLGDLDRVQQIVKVVGYVSSDNDFHEQPAVINGASELLGEVFADAGIHARSAVGVNSLPLNSPVEVELVAQFL